VVPEGSSLVHYYRDNGTLQWYRGFTITTSATGPGSLIQSDFGSGGFHNFEVVVPEGSSLVHYYRDASLQWYRGFIVNGGGSGSYGAVTDPRNAPGFGKETPSANVAHANSTVAPICAAIVGQEQRCAWARPEEETPGLMHTSLDEVRDPVIEIGNESLRREELDRTAALSCTAFARRAWV
jgi:hypothetical protein